MFKKKRKQPASESTKSQKPLPQEVQDAIYEKNLYDDHGPVIIGNRKSRVKF